MTSDSRFAFDAIRRRRLATALLWVTPIFWSSNYVIARAAHGVVPGHVLASGRWAVALLLMIPFVWNDRRAMAAAARTEWAQMLVLGGLGMWICGAFVYEGGQTTSATNIGLIYAATPIGIAAVSRRLLNESMTLWQRWAMFLALFGVVFVICKGDLLHLAQTRFAPGDLWIVVAAISWVAYTVLQRRWPSALSSRQRLACITFGGLLVLLPFTALEVAFTAGVHLSLSAALLMLLAGSIPGFLSYQAYSFMIHELGPTRAGVVMYLSPVYAAFLAWWWLGEAPHVYHLVGGAMILPSIYLASPGWPRSE